MQEYFDATVSIKDDQGHPQDNKDVYEKTLAITPKASDKSSRATQPSSRKQHEARKVSRPRLAVVGGMTSDYKPVSSCWVVEPAREEWSQLTTLPVQGQQDFCVSQTDRGFLVVGGLLKNGEVSKSCFQYVCESDSWVQISDLRTRRAWASAVRVGSQVYILGCEDSKDKLVLVVESINVKPGKWKKHKKMLEGMLHPIAAVLKGEIYVVYNTAPDNKALPAGAPLPMQCYDVDNNKWSHVAPLPDQVKETLGSSAASVGDNLYVVGGWVNICARYTPHSDTWQVLVPPQREHICGCLAMSHGQLCIYGGFDSKW